MSHSCYQSRQIRPVSTRTAYPAHRQRYIPSRMMLLKFRARHMDSSCDRERGHPTPWFPTGWPRGTMVGSHGYQNNTMFRIRRDRPRRWRPQFRGRVRRGGKTQNRRPVEYRKWVLPDGIKTNGKKTIHQEYWERIAEFLFNLGVFGRYGNLRDLRKFFSFLREREDEAEERIWGRNWKWGPFLL